MKNLDHKIGGRHEGKGGIRCSCCRKGSLKETRIASNRAARRAAKIELRMEVAA